MKKIIALLALVLAISAHAQNPFETRPLTFYNTAGAAKTVLAASDTLCSEKIMFNFDMFSWGINLLPGDTEAATIYYRLGKGTGGGLNGWYCAGGGSLSSAIDSFNINNGVVRGTKDGAGFTFNTSFFSGNTQTTVAAGLQDSRDSLRTVTNTVNTNLNNQWFQVVLIPYAHNHDATNTKLLNQNVAIIRRFLGGRP